jgi:hypothetical protein
MRGRGSPTLHAMEHQADAVRMAYSYAWWLTGEEEAAARAVGSARVGAADDPPAALAAVRRSAISERTMCPASEIALLHDRHGLPLPDAARLADIDPDDARTELAHGRLEALTAEPEGPFRHPERLGGLAVGNPADVAHARQCDDCGRVRALLEEGRDALRSMPDVPVPGDLGTRGERSPRAALFVAAGVLLVALVLMLLAGLAQDWAGARPAGVGAEPDAAGGASPRAAEVDPERAWDDTRGWLSARAEAEG